MKKKIVLIDGHSILNRAFYGVPELTNSKGLHTNAVYGFLNILFKLLDEEQADYLTVAFDVHQPTFRHEMFKEYKGTRKAMPEELREQVPVIKEVLKVMNITTVELPGYEADDILGTLAKKCERDGVTVSLVSGDRDLLQLATDDIKIRIPKTKRTGTEIEDYNTKEVQEKYGILPYQIIEMKALMGDSADNIPGVPGIGEKTALKILAQFETLENAYEHVEDIKPNRAKEALKNNYELAQISKVLATIKIDCPIEYNLEKSKVNNIYNEYAYKMLKELEFKTLLRKFDQDVMKETEDEGTFLSITKCSEAANIFRKISNECNKEGFSVGVGVLVAPESNGLYRASEDGQFTFDIIEKAKKEEKLYGMSICYIEQGKINTVFLSTEDEISGNFLMEQFEGLKGGVIVTGDLKEFLYYYDYMNSGMECEKTFFDCKVAAYLLNPLKDTYEYDDLARDFLGMTVPSYEDYFGKASIDKAYEKKEEFMKYACYRCYIPYLSYSVLKEKLDKYNMSHLYFEIELPLIQTLFDMEKRGVHVDKKALKEYGETLSDYINVLEKEIYEMCHEQFNINSPKQLGIILFEKLNLPFAKKTKTGYSTSADILEKLKCEHPVIERILKYRQYSKLKSTYADGLSAYIKDDGRIHGKFNQTITATGRISSTEPNLQNIPIRMEMGRKIRRVFVPKPNYIFVDADYSQIELRVLAHMSKDERLVQAYRDGKDIHKITASQVFHVPFEEVTEFQRRDAKAVNFGIVYGQSAFGLGQELNISRKDADMYIKKYFATYPGVKEFLENQVTQAKEKGYVETMFHRIRPVPELKSSNFMRKSFGERIAMNSPIQGTAADIIKIAMNRVNARLKKGDFRSQLILQIHDELLVEAHEDEVQEVMSLIYDEMLYAAELAIRLEVDVKKGKDWLTAH